MIRKKYYARINDLITQANKTPKENISNWIYRLAKKLLDEWSEKIMKVKQEIPEEVKFT